MLRRNEVQPTSTTAPPIMSKNILPEGRLSVARIDAKTKITANARATSAPAIMNTFTDLESGGSSSGVDKSDEPHSRQYSDGFGARCRAFVRTGGSRIWPGSPAVF